MMIDKNQLYCQFVGRVVVVGILLGIKNYTQYNIRLHYYYYYY